MNHIMSKITKHKLNGTNYFDWSKVIFIYLRSIDKDNHLIDDLLTDEKSRHAFYCLEKQDRSFTAYFMDFKKEYKEINMLFSFSSDNLRLPNLTFFQVLKFHLYKMPSRDMVCDIYKDQLVKTKVVIIARWGEMCATIVISLATLSDIAKSIIIRLGEHS
ncbi:hypothetical protein CXB51_001470 [Gossypium anomalum]|uniref:Uncharacterized protein n=1 Tax=Gossypium anomalum TaxID=47600 RepID=A0A8J5ZCQ0_9ROSI|nr:hypothetical protein CXB51_001470 [Gossypium anomalum]